MAPSTSVQLSPSADPVKGDCRVILNEIALQDFDKLTEFSAGFEMGERLLFNGLVSKAFEHISSRCDDATSAMDLACAVRYKLFEFLRSYKELRGVGARVAEAGR
jgi:hypothetical protein